MPQNPTNEFIVYEIKLSDSEARTMEISGIWSTPSLHLLPVPLWSRVVEPDRVLIMGQMEQTVDKEMTNVKMWLLYNNNWNHLNMNKKSQAHLRILIIKCVNKSYI